MMNQLPPYTNFAMCNAMVEERANQTPRLKVARHIPEFNGLPLRQRVCANCGQMLLSWGLRLMHSAHLDQYDIEEPELVYR